MSASDAVTVGSDPQSITLDYELTTSEWLRASFEIVRRARKTRSRKVMQVFLTLLAIYMCVVGGWRGALIGTVIAIPIATDLSLYLTMWVLSSFWATRWSADLRISDEEVRGMITTQEGGPLTRRTYDIAHSWAELRSALCKRQLLILGFSGSMDVIIPSRLLTDAEGLSRFRMWLTAAGFDETAQQLRSSRAA